MTAFFVTATGTDIGKTYVTAALVRHFRKKGEAIAALKPIVSGFSAESIASSDSGILLDALGLPYAMIDKISPWRFSAPLSPDMAAAREGRRIVFEELVAWSRDRIARFEGTILIEGVGGVMVPLDETHTVRDWMVALGIPIIVVTGSYLGTLSHTLTAIDVLARSELTVAALVINESETGATTLEETVKSLRRFSALPMTTLRRSQPDQREFEALAALLK